MEQTPPPEGVHRRENGFRPARGWREGEKVVDIFGYLGVALLVLFALALAFDWRARRHRGPSDDVREAGTRPEDHFGNTWYDGPAR